MDEAALAVSHFTKEGHLPECFFDFVQGINAVAQSQLHQDVWLVMEEKAKVLLVKVD